MLNVYQPVPHQHEPADGRYTGGGANVNSHAGAAATAASLWIHIATGGYHSCGIREGNTLWCWGAATYGEVGTGAATD